MTDNPTTIFRRTVSEWTLRSRHPYGNPFTDVTYEYYPDGNWHHNPVADRWAMRMGRWVKRVAQHGHVVSVHNGPRLPAFVERFAADPQAVDAIMRVRPGHRPLALATPGRDTVAIYLPVGAGDSKQKGREKGGKGAQLGLMGPVRA